MHFYSCAIKHFWEEEMVEPLTICFIFLSSYKLLIPVTLKSFFVLSLLFNRFLPTSWRSSHTGILYHVSPPKLLKFMMQRSFWVIRVKISILLHRWLLYIETSLWIETEWQLLYIKHQTSNINVSTTWRTVLAWISSFLIRGLVGWGVAKKEAQTVWW